MKDKNSIEIDHKELSELIERVEHAIENELALSVDDMKILLSAITTLCAVQSKLEENDITLTKLRKLLGMIKQSEQRRKRPGPRNGKQGNSKKPRSRKKKNDSESSPKIEHHRMTEHEKGKVCPECSRGKLYKFEPANFLRITGHAKFEATKHVIEQLRCNGCQALFKADVPQSVLDDGDIGQQYGYSARSIMSIDKFYTGTPYYHQSGLSEIFGQPISSSTIYDQCEYVANDVMPVFYELKNIAANAKQFLVDDTSNRILSQEPELRDKPNGKGKQLRTGVYSSGLIAIGDDGHEVVLFDTSLGHAGEHLDSILKKRFTAASLPLVMSDALSSNSVTNAKIKQCYCNAHARRNFYDLEKLYPDDIGWLLDEYGKIWVNETHVKDSNMNDLDRLEYHKNNSLPIMKKLYDWADSKVNSDDFEEHNALGKAIKYFLKHYPKLIMFCTEPGAMIDNNRMEEKLKIIIRGRKTAHFYKTPVGAGVANVLISLIATADQANINIFEYLQVLQRHKNIVKESPGDWVPWKYQDTMAKLKLRC